MWRRSGQSAAAFADQQDISQWALYWWARQGGAGAKGRRPPQRSGHSTTAGAAGFIPVRLVGEEHSDPPAPAEGMVEIQLRGGDVVRVVGEASVERLRAVVTAVRQAC
jgi:hypothetical protein